MTKETISEEFRKIQEDICNQIQKVDGKGVFQSDAWIREEGGGGDTRVLQNGDVLEKAGVNFSAVHGPISSTMADSFKFPKGDFYATGVSIVMHAHNPFVPIIHMNIRYFELGGHSWWFGGGIDLTPIYIDDEEATFFHRTLKAVCDKFDPNYYARFKTWADDYFYIPHRKETRGIGGIFFDRLVVPEPEKEKLFDFVCEIGRSFGPLYSEIIERKRNKEYSENNKQWQALRRSRYVEFNLVYDKGTKFGLESDGRIESILMSMPPSAQWAYNYKPSHESLEQRTLDQLQKGKAWI